jgi:hypothetical protein
MKEVWLKEPLEKDNTWANYGEHTLDWLARSTLPRAKQMRTFLNHNLSELPSKFAEKLKHDLRYRWKTAFFELIIGRMLQETGFNFENEKKLSNGKKPDFLIETSIGEIVIEATSPIINSKVGEFYKKRIPLIEILEKNAPKNWIINIHKLPDIGFNDSKKAFKNFIKKEFKKVAISNSTSYKISERFPEGRLELYLIFKSNSDRSIGIHPAVSYAENSIYRIENSIRDKRNQLRGINKPVILAIQGSNTGTDLNDFDQVLFGHTFTRLNQNREKVEKGFHADGEFISDNHDPTYEGILAFHEIGFTQLKLPTLYLHQNARRELSDIFKYLNIRYYDESTNSIKQLNAHKEADFSNFNFVTI